MRNWGIVVTVFYAIVVLLLLSFGATLLADGLGTIDEWSWMDLSGFEYLLIPILFLVAGQVLLLFLSVDTSWRRLKPQRHAKVTAGLVGLMVAILFVSALLAVGMAIWGDNVDVAIGSWFEDTRLEGMSENAVSVLMLAIVFLIWIFWGAVFYAFSKRVSNVVDSAVSWLIKGSVLELLIAIPCHIIVRQREWCCAQYVSAWGIATGIAIMLMAFGPSAMFLYKRKFDDYKSRTSGRESISD